jgi:co-chaperonin GroES (HSP10)
MKMKPIGNHLLVKIQKQKSTIELLPGTAAPDIKSAAVVTEVGTACVLGLKIGHEVMFRSGTQPTLVDSTDDYDLIIVPESLVMYVKNWED